MLRKGPSRRRSGPQPRDEPDVAESTDSVTDEKPPKRISNTSAEIVSATLLGIASIVSAWCALQANRWSTEHARGFAEVERTQFENVRLAAVASRLTLIDVVTFLELVRALEADNPRLRAFIRDNARGEFRPALEAWLRAAAQKDAETQRSGVGLGTPFERPEYRLAVQDEVDGLQRRAAESARAMAEATSNTDAYVRQSVNLALALFLIGIARGFDVRNVRLALLTVAGAALLGIIAFLARLPVAPAA